MGENLWEAAQARMDEMSWERAEAERQQQERDQARQEAERQRQEAYDRNVAQSRERTGQFLNIMRERDVPMTTYCEYELKGGRYHISDSARIMGWLAVCHVEYDSNYSLSRYGEGPVQMVVERRGTFVSEAGDLYACGEEKLLDDQSVVKSRGDFWETDPTLLAGDKQLKGLTDRLAEVLDPNSGYRNTLRRVLPPQPMSQAERERLQRLRDYM